MVSYVYRMPAGIPGDINRAFDASVYPEVLTPVGTTGHPTVYGVPVMIDATSGQVRILAAGDTRINGILARPFPGRSSQDALGVSTVPDSGPCDVLRRGCISVLLSGAVGATKDQSVWVWTAAPSGSHILGGWEASDPAGSGFLIANARFRGPADANGITEIEFNL
jgi:hypothetical protein